MAAFTMGAVCACGDDDDDDGGSGYGYAEMDGHKSTFKYAYYSYDNEYIIWFFEASFQEMMSNPNKDYAVVSLYLDEEGNEGFSSGSFAEGTISGVGIEYSPYAAKDDDDEFIMGYISGMVAPALEKTTVTITKTGNMRYRIVAKDQVYMVQEDGHGVWYNGNKPGVRTVVGNFEWEGPIADLKASLPEGYWYDEDDKVSTNKNNNNYETIQVFGHISDGRVHNGHYMCMW